MHISKIIINIILHFVLTINYYRHTGLNSESSAILVDKHPATQGSI